MKKIILAGRCFFLCVGSAYPGFLKQTTEHDNSSHEIAAFKQSMLLSKPYAYLA
jgi:hypothetical protein